MTNPNRCCLPPGSDFEKCLPHACDGHADATEVLRAVPSHRDLLPGTGPATRFGTPPAEEKLTLARTHPSLHRFLPCSPSCLITDNSQDVAPRRGLTSLRTPTLFSLPAATFHSASARGRRQHGRPSQYEEKETFNLSCVPIAASRLCPPSKTAAAFKVQPIPPSTASVLLFFNLLFVLLISTVFCSCFTSFGQATPQFCSILGASKRASEPIWSSFLRS